MKIVVIGPHHVGKSTFVRQFCGENTMNLDKMGIDGPTTVAMDFGVKKFEDIKLFVFGTPGMSHFAIIREVLTQGADGIIFLIDAADPSKDKEVREIWNEYQRFAKDVPVVILANKQDLPNARSTEELKKIFKFLEKKKVIETSTKENTYLDKAMHELLKMSMDKIFPLISKLNKHHSKINSFEKISKEMKLNKSDFRKYLRALSAT
ncbi:MAG: GTP-binding protein [Candidatus Helarchaeota archaeon]